MLGIIENSSRDYHDGKGVCFADLRLMANKSPLHVWQQKIAPDRPLYQHTDDIITRAAVRCALLESVEFKDRYQAIPEGIDKRTKIGKELFADIEADGRTPLRHEQAGAVLAIKARLQSHPVIRYVMAAGGKLRQSIYWQDSETGVLCKCRPHYMVEPCQSFPDGLMLYFTPTELASERGFSEIAFNRQYHIKAAFDADGFQQTYGTSGTPVYLFVPYETAAPYACAVRSASEGQLIIGRHKARAMLELFAKCEASGTWPGYAEAISPVELPAWGAKELQELQAAAAA